MPLVAVAKGGLFRRRIGAAVVGVSRESGRHAFDAVKRTQPPIPFLAGWREAKMVQGYS